MITKVYEPSITCNSIFMPGLMASEQGRPFFLLVAVQIYSKLRCYVHGTLHSTWHFNQLFHANQVVPSGSSISASDLKGVKKE